MSNPFDRFHDRVDNANDNRTRRALLAELGMWRAQHLTDIPAMREAAFAMSRLYTAVGSHDDAIREARSLVSLCKTSPKASTDELKHANAWLQSLGGTSQKRSSKKSKNNDQGGPSPVERARDAARRGDWDGIITSLRGRRGAKAAVSRTYATLASALDKDGKERESALRDLADQLRHKASLPPVDAEAAAAAEVQESEPTEPKVAESQLAKVLGRTELPRKRRALLELMDAFARENPEQVDALAAAALEHHVATRGLKVPAPWLVGTTAHALATGPAPRTRTEMERLKALDAFAVSAYAEWPFNRAVEVLAEAVLKDWTFGGLRRGVLSRGEPDDRKLWTLRLEKDGQTRMIVVAGAEPEPYPDALVTTLADRVIELEPLLILVAPGPGNASLREALASRGVTTMEDDANANLLTALEAADAVKLSATEAVPETKKPHVALDDLLFGDSLPEVEQMKPLIANMRRAFEAFRNAEKLIEQDDGDARLARLLSAAHQVAEEGRRLNEGTTLSIRASARWPDGEVAALLKDPDVAERYGGAGFEDVIAIASVAQDAGFTVDRVLRGVTRRERREQPGLDPLSRSLRSLWRIVAQKGEDTRELWFAAGLEPEARAGIPLLLLQDRERVVVWPIDAGLLDWYGTLNGPTAIGWMGPESGPSVREALESAVQGQPQS